MKSCKYYFDTEAKQNYTPTYCDENSARVSCDYMILKLFFD